MRPIFYLFIVLLLGGGLYFYSLNPQDVPKNNDNGQGITDLYEGWKDYKYEDYGITFKAPEDWEIEKNKSWNFKSKDEQIGYLIVTTGLPVDHGSEAVGPMISDSEVLISDNINARQRIFQGDGSEWIDFTGESGPALKEIIIDFENDSYSFGLAIKAEVSSQDLWRNVDLFIKSIKVRK